MIGIFKWEEIEQLLVRDVTDGVPIKEYVRASIQSKRQGAASTPFAENPTGVASTAARLTPACQGIIDEAPCWRAVSNQPGCHVWDSYPAARGTANFDGASTCTDGRLNGFGTTTWNWYDADDGWQSASSHGSYLDGKANGPWVEESADGDVYRGSYLDGKRHGQWVEESADGGSARGPWIDGERHGPWVLENADGTTDRGPVVDGQRHGQWVIQYASGLVGGGAYVDGQRHGQWVIEIANRIVLRGPFVNGKMHGQWTWELPDGTTVARTRYENGEYVGSLDD